ncbi:MAG TPA: hypothetical protein VHO24_02695 [Opitutaceae bacterium]|nr:hypothetical protein [Opitutaceae bacterium]
MKRLSRLVFGLSLAANLFLTSRLWAQTPPEPAKSRVHALTGQSAARK